MGSLKSAVLLCRLELADDVEGYSYELWSFAKVVGYTIDAMTGGSSRMYNHAESHLGTVLRRVFDQQERGIRGGLSCIGHS